MIRWQQGVLGCLILFLVTPLCAQSITHIRPDNRFDDRDLYFLELLKIVLEETRDEYGSFEIVAHKETMTQSRAMRNLQKGGGLDILWTMTSATREEHLRPIRIPLLKGLLGYRVLIIRRGDLDTFANIYNVNDLRRLVAGQGHDWPDTNILRANGFLVETSSHFEGLFGMLRKGRIDYFPRGVNEAWTELANRRYDDLTVEPSLLIHYRAPIYFFTAPNDDRLAERIETGMERAMANGRFMDLMLNHSATRGLFRGDRLKGRRIFELENPLLPDTTPDDPGYWLTPDQVRTIGPKDRP